MGVCLLFDKSWSRCSALVHSSACHVKAASFLHDRVHLLAMTSSPLRGRPFLGCLVSFLFGRILMREIDVKSHVIADKVTDPFLYIYFE